ncbi:helix-turn-helix domain-containing GNAT family N-acetyltransferase [Actinoplanes sp. NPDC049596]|uniref:bifunctional helix-turn-helix transcriptional regulator/GNAT family N-acetyltransferase n=1 Tax=unclassified Actinoplanes TaxID=2626549 RepID=UPI00341CE63D
MDEIERVRDFNRYYTRRIGVLHLGGDRPFGEARLLFEIGAGADLRDLRARLGLDSGYLSRLLRSLSTQGLVTVTPRPGDARVRTAALTEAGRTALADLEERSRASVAGLLAPLTPPERDRLLRAQAEIHRLLRLAAITLTPVADSSPAARACLRAYASELVTRFPEGYDADGALLPPGTLHDGTFLLATEEETPVGCGLWQRFSDGAAEIRHLWVSPAARGLGLARRLLTALETDAAGHGVTTLRLGTHSSLVEAIALYRSAGYQEIPPYDDSPYNQLAFQKLL